MSVTVHRWALRKDLAWVHTTQVSLDAPPSDSSTIPQSECLYACDSAQMGSAEGLSQGAHQLSSFRLGVYGRLFVGFVFTPKPTPRPWWVLHAPPSDSSTTRLSECLYTLAGVSSALSCWHPLAARRLNIYGVHRIVAAASHEARQRVYACLDSLSVVV